MSVAQIKDELRLLTARERRAVEEFLRELDMKGPAEGETSTAGSSRPERFVEAKAHLFEHYGDLLEKLAR